MSVSFYPIGKIYKNNPSHHPPATDKVTHTYTADYTLLKFSNHEKTAVSKIDSTAMNSD